MTEVEYTREALNQLSELDPPVAERILDKVEEATDWTEYRLEKLSGYPYYKIRAGDWRAIVSWHRKEDKLIVKAVGHRRNIYDRHLPP